MDEIIRAVSNYEMILSKVFAISEPIPVKDVFAMAKKDFKKT